MAGGDDALLQSVEGAEDETDTRRAPDPQHGIDEQGRADRGGGKRNDPVHPWLSARGRIARRADRSASPTTRGTPILDEADHPIRLDTGPEPIAGSTRMKAGTAQRVALNCCRRW